MNIKYIAIRPLMYLLPIGTMIANVSATEISPFNGGAGTESDPYEIATGGQLDSIRDFPNAHFILVNDIIFSSEESWVPIGTSSSEAFRGSLDGNGHYIQGIRISASSSSSCSAGLFGYNYGTIKNLGLIECNISVSVSTRQTTSKNSYAGGFAGYNTGTISNCYNCSGIVAAHFNNTNSSYDFSSCEAGGIAGNCNNAASITNCYALDITTNAIGGLNSDATMIRSLDDMKKQSTYMGFDFNSIWSMSNTHYPFPTLMATPHGEQDNITEFAGGWACVHVAKKQSKSNRPLPLSV